MTAVEPWPSDNPAERPKMNDQPKNGSGESSRSSARGRKKTFRSQGHELPGFTTPCGSRARVGDAMPVDIIVEVEQHIGEDKVRCISMHPHDGWPGA